MHLLQLSHPIHRRACLTTKDALLLHAREFIRRGRELSLDAVIYDRLKEKEQTTVDAIDRGCLENGYLDDEDLRIIFERLLEKMPGLEY